MFEQPPSAPATTDIHEWISFESADESWLFDVTFLTSRWQCIWDAGCPGIREFDASAAQEGCCSYGAHFADDDDRIRVATAAGVLTEEFWQYHRPVDEAFTRDGDGWTTASVDDACVFLNRPGFARGHGCALHAGALAASASPIDWKPDVCWQLPLRLEHHEDENGRSVSTLRPWRRHDWGDAGDDFASWCTQDPNAYRGDRSVVDTMEPELRALLGDARFERLRTVLRDRLPSTPVEIPGPTTRTRSAS